MALQNQAKVDIETAASEAKRVIAQSTAENVKILKDAAGEATKLLANAAAEALKVTNAKGADDHDMLVRIDEQLKSVKGDILSLKNDTASNIQDLKNGTSSKIEDHEKRLFKLEQAKSTTNLLISIGIGVIVILVTMLVYHLFQQPFPKVL